MQSNLCTETFNYFDLDQAKIEQRANDEFEKITLTGGRPAERILYHCKIGQAAEVYFLDKCGYTDNCACCLAAQLDLPPDPHSEIRRERITSEMRKDPKDKVLVEISEERVKDYEDISGKTAMRN